MHGGAAPQVKAAAQVRAASVAAHAEAARMVARAGVDADPIEHLLESLHRAAALVEVWGSMVSALDAAAEQETAEQGALRGELGYVQDTNPDTEAELVVHSKDRLLALDKSGMAKLHPYVVEYQGALERRAKFAKLCIDAGIAERQVELYEQQVELAHRAFEAMLDDLGLDDAKRQEARRTYARHLRSVS